MSLVAETAKVIEAEIFYFKYIFRHFVTSYLRRRGLKTPSIDVLMR